MRTVLMLLAAIICASAQAQQNSATAPGGKPPRAAPLAARIALPSAGRERSARDCRTGAATLVGAQPAHVS